MQRVFPGEAPSEAGLRSICKKTSEDSDKILKTSTASHGGSGLEAGERGLPQSKGNLVYILISPRAAKVT